MRPTRVPHPLRFLLALAIVPVAALADDRPFGPIDRVLERDLACWASCPPSPYRLACQCRCMGFTAATPRPTTTYRGCLALTHTCVRACRHRAPSERATCEMRCHEQGEICTTSVRCHGG